MKLAKMFYSNKYSAIMKYSRFERWTSLMKELFQILKQNTYTLITKYRDHLILILIFLWESWKSLESRRKSLKQFKSLESSSNFCCLILYLI